MRKQHRAAEEFHRIGDTTVHVCLGLGSVLKALTSWRVPNKCNKKGLEVEERKLKTELVRFGYMTAKTLQRHDNNL